VVNVYPEKLGGDYSASDVAESGLLQTMLQDVNPPLWNAAIEQKASKEIINLGGIEEWSINDANKILRDIIKYETKIP
jgi:hypothetical protein